MRSRLVSGAARLLLGCGLVATILVVPARLADGRRVLRPAERELGACLAASCPEALREALVLRIEDHLFARMPGLDPVMHEDLARTIVAEGEVARLDPLLVLAVIEVESRFDPLAESGAGAVGLMQLLPATLQREAEALGLGEIEPTDPVANVRAGVSYLRRCLDSYPQIDLALMAYNAGPNRLYGWIQDGGVPAQVTGYARQVKAIHRRLRQAFEAPARPAVAEAGAPRLVQ